jgi:hypothetical protein
LSGRARPDSARLVTARLHGAAKRRANWHELDEDETAAAVAELRKILEGRDDAPALLAEVAGVLLGACEGELDEPRAKGAARLCIAAGADESLIPQWITEGQRRAENARKLPHSGQPRHMRRPPSGGGAR